MKVIDGIFVDVFKDSIAFRRIIAVDDNDYLEQIKELLKCSSWDFKLITLNGIQCYVYFDDFGKCKDEVKDKPGIFLVNEKTEKICDVIVGNVWIEKYEGGEDTTSFYNFEFFSIVENCLVLSENENKNVALVSLDNWVDVTERFGDSND